MSETSRHDGNITDAQDVARLLQLAKRREGASTAARAQARAAAHQAWRGAVAVRTRRRWAWIAVPITAAAALVLVIVWSQGTDRAVTHPGQEVARVLRGQVSLVNGTTVRSAAMGEAIRAGDAIRTGQEQVAALALEGGGELRLNGGSRVAFGAARRFALDHGEVFVDTGHTTGSTIEVATPAGILRDVGTRFDVRVSEQELRVRVREGAVRLDTTQGHTEASAGQQLVARAGQRPSVDRTVLHGASWDWLLAAAPFRTEGATLESFLRWVEAEGGLRVEFEDPAARTSYGPSVLHGSIGGLTLRESLDVILPACGLSYRAIDGRIVIVAAGKTR